MAFKFFDAHTAGPQGRATTFSAWRLWHGFRRGLADMGSLGLRPTRMHRPTKSDAEALAGDWQLVLSGLDRIVRRTERDGRR